MPCCASSCHPPSSLSLSPSSCAIWSRSWWWACRPSCSSACCGASLLPWPIAGAPPSSPWVTPSAPWPGPTPRCFSATWWRRWPLWRRHAALPGRRRPPPRRVVALRRGRSPGGLAVLCEYPPSLGAGLVTLCAAWTARRAPARGSSGSRSPRSRSPALIFLLGVPDPLVQLALAHLLRGPAPNR